VLSTIAKRREIIIKKPKEKELIKRNKVVVCSKQKKEL
jgi:hypothetical protein